MFRLAALLALFAVAVSAAAAEDPAARSLNVGLHADWEPTSLAAEAAAWIATTSGNATAWSFLFNFAGSTDEERHGSEKENFDRVKAAAGKVLSSREVATLQWALSARVMSPRVASQVADGRRLLKHFPERSGEDPDAFALVVKPAQGTLRLITEKDGKGKSLDVTDANLAESIARMHPADHVVAPPCSSPTDTFLVYADLTAPSFPAWYKLVTGRLRDNTRHVLRHWSAPGRLVTPVALQGYAVDVAVKSTEYRVVDDRVFKHRLFPDAAYGVPNDAPPPPSATDGKLALDAYKQPFVGLSVAESIRSAAEAGGVSAAVKLLRSLAEDGPVTLADSVKTGTSNVDGGSARAAGKLADHLRSRIGGGDVIFVNGRPLPVAQAIAQGLPSTLQCLAAVGHASAAVQQLGAGRESVASLLHRSGGEEAPIDLRVKLVDAGEGEIVTWYNDLTKDKRYRSWDAFENSTEGFARYAEKVDESRQQAADPGDFQALVKVRANLLSLVIALDPGDPRQLGFLSLPEQIVRSDLPLRAGIILVPNNEVSTLVTAGFHYLRLGRGKKAAVSFISTMQSILEYVGGLQGKAPPLSPKIVELAFDQVAREGDYSSLAAVVRGHHEVKTLLQNARKWADSMGLFEDGADSVAESSGDAEKTFSMVSTINGILLKDVVGDTLPVALKEQHRIAELLQAGNDTAHLDPADWTKHDPSLLIVNRVSKSLLSNEPADILAGTGSVTKRLTMSQLLDLKKNWSELKYLMPVTDKNVKPGGAVTLWLASCRHSLDLYTSRKSMLEEFAKGPFVHRSNLRIGYLDENSVLSDEITKCDINLEKESDVRFVINGRIILASEVESTEDLEAEIAAEYLSAASKFGASQAPELNPWDAALLASAAIVDVDSACSSTSGRGQPKIRDDALASVLTLAAEAKPGPYVFPSKNEILAATKSEPMTIVAVTDPLGSFAGATSAFLASLSEAFAEGDIFIGLVLVPSVGVRDEVPKAHQVFSRFLLSPRPEFSKSDELIPARASFDQLPQRSILTVDVKQPRPWFIAPFSANYDMDNVILSSLPENVPVLYAQYVLKSLLVEGSCVDENTEPPQGLQLELSRDGLQPVDTLVMGNLGYFQLRVPVPGQWGLSLAAGRSSEVFEIESVDSRLGAMYGAAGAGAHTFTSDTSGDINVFVDSLNGACGTLLRVKRKPGYKGERVLNLEGSGENRNAPIARAKEAVKKMGSLVSGVFEKSSRFVGGEKTEEQKKIHVFSVASGHLYERFLKIMMLSVSKHAKRPVKFWLLENYLSPSFKKLLPSFSEKHGFEVGMVTYRWPGWLREQSEKQRIIWAYKILYLDVLFPLKVRRIIFVDADQVVRSDLSELMDIDLEGAPYGYVPFCDSRKEVEGYRFWKTGFWETTLQGKKYHISALYVVDLETLRGTASGDKLRAMYQSLSADPNSLSNLDQDLPNYAAAVREQTGNNVPIFGLPQNWLWCESWCDDESKKTAKTIDLCNNPMTKEPKLVSAKRIIAEWTDLDDEASNTTESIYARLALGGGKSAPESLSSNKTTSEDRMTSKDKADAKETTARKDTEKQEL